MNDSLAHIKYFAEFQILKKETYSMSKLKEEKYTISKELENKTKNIEHHLKIKK